MANGLRVITPRIKVIEDSDYDKYMYYTENQNPEEFANIVKSIDFKDGYDSIKIIKDFHNKSKIELDNILKQHYLL